MNKYVYDGQVSEYGRLIQQNWHGETWANSESKAKTNLAFQFKKATGRPSMAKITLNGQIRQVS